MALGTQCPSHAIPSSATAVLVGQRLGAGVNMFQHTAITAAMRAGTSRPDLGGFAIKRNVNATSAANSAFSAARKHSGENHCAQIRAVVASTAITPASSPAPSTLYTDSCG